MNENIRVERLKQYLDKSYISAILCDYHYNFFYKINMIAMLPLILGSSVLTVLNSSEIRDDILKVINITINGTNAVLMALMNNYKIVERINCYKSLYIKYQQLSHRIESAINMSNEVSEKVLNDFITEYDNLQNDNNYSYLNYYKNKVVKIYGKTKCLPNSLALEQDMIKLELTVVNA